MEHEHRLARISQRDTIPVAVVVSLLNLVKRSETMDYQVMNTTELLESAEQFARQEMHQVAAVRRAARDEIDTLNREFYKRGLKMVQLSHHLPR